MSRLISSLYDSGVARADEHGKNIITRAQVDRMHANDATEYLHENWRELARLDREERPQIRSSNPTN